MTYRIQSSPLPQHVAIDLPASKSLSNRALILQGLCAAACRLHNLSDCDDTQVMLRAMDTLAGSRTGVSIDIGAAGTAMRFLTAYLAATEGVDVVLTGSERMRHRPIAVLVDALRALGADIDYAEADGFPPLRIRGRHLSGGALSIDGGISSQYISALLMIAPTLSDGLRLSLEGRVTSEPYIRMTLAMMRRFGVESVWQDNVISIMPRPYAATDYTVESDWSAASYWYELIALEGSADDSIELKNLWQDSLQGDAAVAQYFAELGVDTEYDPSGIRLGRTRVAPAAVAWNLAGQPDLAQTLVATCCALGVHFDIDGLHTLRIKETSKRLTASRRWRRSCAGSAMS